MNYQTAVSSSDYTELSTWSPQARASRGKLSVRSGDGIHQFDVMELATVGTALGNPIRIIHPTVSRIHAELRASAHGIWVRDLDSTNGCRVNGILTKEALLPDNATLGFGDVEAQFVYVDPAAVPVAENGRFGEMVGVSNRMRQLFLVLDRCARVDTPVLISGEPGSGKTLAARAIHAQSARAGAPLWTVDCAALMPDATLEEVVGVVQSREDAGPAESIDNAGTLLLDEVGELPLPVQAKLVRWLEGKVAAQSDGADGTYRRARLVSTSQRDLRELVNRGAFREDLYFRIAVIPVELPPLRHRIEDIPLLARHFLGQAPWPPELELEALQQRTWLGNVRELRNFIRSQRGRESRPTANHGSGSWPVQQGVEPTSERSWSARLGPDDGLPQVDQPLRSFREQWTDAGERRYLQSLLERTKNNVPEAARLAQVDRTYVYRLIRRHRR